MKSICQLDNYSTQISEITGRTVYINESYEQYLISPECDFRKVSKAADDWLNRLSSQKIRYKLPQTILNAVEPLKYCKSRADVAMNIDYLLEKEFKAELSNRAIKDSQRFLVELMVCLWSNGCIAWPAKNQTPFLNPTIILENPGFEEHSRKFLEKIWSYLNKGTSGDSANFRFILDHALSRVPIQEVGDLTPTTLYFTQERSRLKKMHHGSVNGLLAVLRECHPIANNWFPENFGLYQLKMGHLARDDDFKWLTSREPEMNHWAELAKEHLKNTPANFKKRKSSLNNFLAHYQEHPELPRNPVEYFDIRKRPTALYQVEGNKGRQVMTVLHEFLEEVLFKTCSQPNDNELPILMPGYAVPIVKATYKNVNKGETHREAMPVKLIKLAMSILMEDDFSWAKTAGGHKDTFRWKNPKNGDIQTIWSPVRAYAILLKLILPARTYQIRVLDSGEGDTYIYNKNGSWTKNEGPNRPKSTKEVIKKGVFRKFKRKDGSDGTIFYFNTNKTSDIDSITKGYEMPWEKTDALELLAELRDWQEKFNPIKEPTPWTRIQELKKTKHVDDLHKMGSAFFLFRDPCTSNPDLPVTDVRIRNLWLKLMDELEKRLLESGETLPNGEPIRLVLTRDNKGAPSSATFDLHSLRVSIITAMYEEGVPPEYLMKIVGHATVLMTLYYTKINAETISLRMNEATQQRLRKEQSEMVSFINKTSRVELESALAFKHQSSLDAAKKSSGVGLLVMDHGICPTYASRCNEGLSISSPGTQNEKYEAVPGGASNCVRCRFFITGPAFLFGMEAHLNDLLYRLKNASETFEKSQERFENLSDEFANALSEKEPFHKKRELELAENSYHSAMAETDDIALSVQSAYSLTEQCIKIASSYQGQGPALVAAGGVGQIEAVLSETHEFEQLHRICTNSTFFDGLNIEWQRANLERARLFDRMLRNSGEEARFSLLNDEDSRNAINHMGNFLYSRLDAKKVHSLLDGHTTLKALGIHRDFKKYLNKIEPKLLELSKSSPILEEK